MDLIYILQLLLNCLHLRRHRKVETTQNTRGQNFYFFSNELRFNVKKYVASLKKIVLQISLKYLNICVFIDYCSSSLFLVVYVQKVIYALTHILLNKMFFPEINKK